MSYNPNNPNGQATKANSQPVVIASDDDLQGKLGIVTETAPGTDTASSGLNGRLQRIAQRLSSLIALIPASLGQKTMANSMAVVVASDQSSVPVNDNGGSLTVDGTVSVTGVATETTLSNVQTAVQLLDDTVVTDNGGFTDGTTKVSVAGYIFDEVAGTALTENDAAASRIDSKRAQIHVIEDATTRGQRLAVSPRGGAEIEGVLAHDAPNTGALPVLSGYEAIAHGTNPTAVAAADITKGYANRAGIPFVIGGHPNIVSAEYITTASQTDDPVIAVVAAGTKIVVTSITVIASAANTVNVSVRIGFGTATLPAQGASGADGVAKIILSHPNIPAGSGIVKGNGAGIVGIGGDDEDLRITCSAPTTGSLVVQVDYYTIAS